MSYLRRPDTSAHDRRPDRYQIRVGALVLRDHTPAILYGLAKYVVSSGSQRTAFAKLHRAGAKRAEWKQAEAMTALGWPEIKDMSPPNTSGAVADSFISASTAVLEAFFKAAIAEAHKQWCAATKESGDHASTHTVRNIMEPLMRGEHQQTSSFVDHAVDLVDCLRKKPGASTGFAISDGVYPSLGKARDQGELNLMAAGELVGTLLEKIVLHNDQLPTTSRFFRASLKLDAYPRAKVHGREADDIGTRLSFGGCWLRTCITRAFCGQLLGRAVQAGLSDLGVDRGSPPAPASLDIGGTEVHICVVNAQAVDGAIMSGIQGYCEQLLKDKPAFVFLCIAGDSVYAYFPAVDRADRTAAAEGTTAPPRHSDPWSLSCSWPQL